MAADLGELAPAECVIEAVAEDLAVKQALFADLEKVVAPGCVLATNTSSLSPAAIAAGLSHPGRLVGLHFFNPAPVMRLVEVISGLATDPAVAAAVTRLAGDWGKQVVQASATPGFIVNRVARPFYAEALRLAEEQAASPATIDAVLTQAGGFRMGPFALMDLVGQDVNEAVTRSVWTAFGYDPRFAPSPLQRAMVDAGWLGRKTGRGWFRYGDDAEPPEPDAAPPRSAPPYITEHGESPLRVLLTRSGVEIRAGEDRDGTVGLPGGAVLARCDGRPATALGRPAVVVDRTLDDATAEGYRDRGVRRLPGRRPGRGHRAAAGGRPDRVRGRRRPGPGRHPDRRHAGERGRRRLAQGGGQRRRHRHRHAARHQLPARPAGLGDRWGPGTILSVLDAIQAWYGEDRYRPSALLRRIAAAGGSLT